MLAVVNATLVMKDHYIPDATLLIENGRIRAFGPSRSLPIPEACDRLDAQGLFVGPGLVDIHTHANDKTFFWEDPEACARYHLKQGTTTVLAATYMSLDREKLLGAIETLRRAMGNPNFPNLCGIYMEGPYLNPKFGCD